MATPKYKGIARLLVALSVSFAAILVASCDNIGPDRVSTQSSVQASTVTVSGTVVFRDKDGGFFGILTDNGGQYEPSNLGPQYETDGLHVTITGKLATSRLGAHSWGNPIEIDRVQAKS
jgi:hypothetical protein